MTFIPDKTPRVGDRVRLKYAQRTSAGLYTVGHEFHYKSQDQREGAYLVDADGNTLNLWHNDMNSIERI